MNDFIFMIYKIFDDYNIKNVFIQFVSIEKAERGSSRIYLNYYCVYLNVFY